MNPEIVEVGEGAANASDLLVHSERGSPLYAHLLAQLVQPQFPMPMGILYREDKPTYESLANQQVQDAIAKQGAGDLTKLLYSGMVWEVGADGTRH
jgi:2-oxoglutarate ferredoxin oxidoreductase subunit beta